MKKVLYVTSFARDMYNASGKNLIKSFLQTNQDGELLVCYENFDFVYYDNNKVFGYDIYNSEFLQTWLNDNKDIIPDYLGGTATEKSNPKAFDPANRKASRWFRKVAALNYATNTYRHEYDYIIWVDSDCTFSQKIPMKLLINNLDNYDIFYYLGNKRFLKNKGIESGFFGFNMKKKGNIYLKKVFNYFTSKEFIKEDRWDDGYIFKVIMLQNTNKLSYNDVVKNSNSIHVMQEGPFANYIKHNKGIHKKLNILL